MKSKLLLELYQNINKHFKIGGETFGSEKTHIYDLAAIRQPLIERIWFMMNNEYERLLQILIRIDVNEVKLKKAFKENGFEDMPLLIADLVIERQTIKAQMRTAMLEDTEKDAS